MSRRLIFLASLLGAPLVLPPAARAQSSFTDDDLRAPDMAALHRARPPMGDCPVGEVDEPAGLPETSHLLHLGVPRFFLDHRRRLRLTVAQVDDLEARRTAALNVWKGQQRALEQLEIRLWGATGASEPDMATVVGILSEMEAQRTAQRLGFIRAVHGASSLLTLRQREKLVGRPVVGEP